MFCSKCGAELIGDAAFCQKCGARVYSEENVKYQSDTPPINDEHIDNQSNMSADKEGTMVDKLDMMLTDIGPNKVMVIKEVRNRTGLGLKEAKELVEKAPILLKKAVTEEEAESLKAGFMKAGAIVAFTDQIGNSVDIAIHCKSCGAVLDDVKNPCKSCGNSYEMTSPHQKQSVLNSMEDSKCWDREEVWKKLFDIIKKIVKERIDNFMIMPTAGKVFMALIIGLPAIFCALIIVVLLKVILSNIILLIISIAGGYIAYQKWGAQWVTTFIYDALSKELLLPDGMTTQTLAETLNGEFDYPYFKSARYVDDGCLIEGKYSVYYAILNGSKMAELECVADEDDKKYRTILWEAMTIRSYLNKFFAPSSKSDAEKDFKTLKLAEKQRKITVGVSSIASLLITVSIILAVIENSVPGSVSGIFKPGNEVRNAYLSQYSDAITIEDAFDNFFDNPKWSKYKDDGYSYVVFSGACEYLEEKADVRITFKITGENFIVDSLDINGRTQNDFMLYALLASIYSEEE